MGFIFARDWGLKKSEKSKSDKNKKVFEQIDDLNEMLLKKNEEQIANLQHLQCKKTES